MQRQSGLEPILAAMRAVVICQAALLEPPTMDPKEQQMSDDSRTDRK
jgi:hypothetical protein